jgi:hypothetical protein
LTTFDKHHYNRQNAMKPILRRCSLLLCMVCLALLSSPAHAGLVQVVSVPGILANDTILWSALGGDTIGLTPPVTSTTTDGQSYTVTGPSALTIFQGSTYNADFLPGDFVISAFDINSFTPLSAGIEIDLPGLVYAIGAQVQVNAFGPFSATLQAFDATSLLLGSVTVNSSVGGNGDGSAVFLGGRTTGNPIASVVISSPTAGIALDTVSLQDTPEPACLMLVAPALAALLLRKRARP